MGCVNVSVCDWLCECDRVYACVEEIKRKLWLCESGSNDVDFSGVCDTEL